MRSCKKIRQKTWHDGLFVISLILILTTASCRDKEKTLPRLIASISGTIDATKLRDGSNLWIHVHVENPPESSIDVDKKGLLYNIGSETPTFEKFFRRTTNTQLVANSEDFSNLLTLTTPGRYTIVPFAHVREGTSYGDPIRLTVPDSHDALAEQESKIKEALEKANEDLDSAQAKLNALSTTLAVLGTDIAVRNDAQKALVDAQKALVDAQKDREELEQKLDLATGEAPSLIGKALNNNIVGFTIDTKNVLKNNITIKDIEIIIRRTSGIEVIRQSASVEIVNRINGSKSNNNITLTFNPLLSQGTITDQTQYRIRGIITYSNDVIRELLEYEYTASGISSP